jgi:cytoskeleton protein RodZ
MNEALTPQAVPQTDPRAGAPGARLALARQARGLSPADVARQLKLSVWQVEALEDGRYRQLPGPVFVRGFIRNYARLVELDPEELLRAAADSLPRPDRQVTLPEARNIPFPARRRPRWAWPALTVALVVGLLAAYEFRWNAPETQVVLPEAPVPVPAALPAEGATREVAAVRPVGEAAPVEAPADAASVSEAARDAAPSPAVRVEPVSAPAAQRGAKEIRLVFQQESWVEIRDRDEKVLFSQLNPPGTQQLISGLPPFSVVVGNSHGVRMTYDEKPVDLALHTKVDVARLILR